MIARLVAVSAGVWLIVAPAALGYGGVAAANDRIFGPIAAAFAFVAIWQVVRPLRWATLPIGVWLVAAPAVLGYGDGAAISTMVAGLSIIVTAPVRGPVPQRYGEGWSALIRPR